VSAVGHSRQRVKVGARNRPRYPTGEWPPFDPHHCGRASSLPTQRVDPVPQTLDAARRLLPPRAPVPTDPPRAQMGSSRKGRKAAVALVRPQTGQRAAGLRKLRARLDAPGRSRPQRCAWCRGQCRRREMTQLRSLVREAAAATLGSGRCRLGLVAHWRLGREALPIIDSPLSIDGTP
jgi:hypothetical protein